MSAVLRIVLTGGIGSGKSTVASKFQDLGVPVIDADKISRDIVETNKPCLNNIVDEFGEDILTTKGILDRNKLRKIIFNNDAAKKKLEEILHPVIYQEIDKQITKVHYPYCLIVVPLIIETQATDRFDRILVVDTLETTQLERASSRDKASFDDIKKIIKNQANHELRLKLADDIIDNNLTIEELNEAVLILHEKYLKLSSYNN